MKQTNKYANEPQVPYGDTRIHSVRVGRWAKGRGELTVRAVPVTTADENIDIYNTEHFQFDIDWMSPTPALTLDDPEQMTFSTLEDLVEFRDRLNEAIEHLQQLPKIGDGPAIAAAATNTAKP